MKKTLLLIIFFSFFSCTNNEEDLATVDRKFYMGVTPWPANFSFSDLDVAYDFINNHCDIVSHHFDEGIPYEEAFHNQTMPLEIQQQITYRNLKTNDNKKILLSVSALDLSRKQKAKYYEHSLVSNTIQQQWISKEFNDASVVTAYINYVNYLIAGFNPDYVNFGVESNLETFTAAEFSKYKDFISQVYAALKTAHPNLPLFISFMVNETNESFLFANELLPYTDYIGLSAYPYTGINASLTGPTNPDAIPTNFFEKYIDMADKPFCFAETAYIAEDLVIPFYGLNKQGTPEWQKAYLQKIINLCQSRNAEFLIWFCSKDYDAGNAYLQQQGLYTDLFGLWQDTGLIDENNNQRLAYTLWNNWYKKSKK